MREVRARLGKGRVDRDSYGKRRAGKVIHRVIHAWGGLQRCSSLAPAGGEGEADADESEADQHVPRADIRDWVEGLGHIEDDDPDQADEEGGEHDRDQPLRALNGFVQRSHINDRWLLILLLTLLRNWHGAKVTRLREYFAMTEASNRLRIAVIDNRDSFVFNLVRYLEELGAQCSVFENSTSPMVLEAYDGVMISPGPGNPSTAGNSLEIIDWAYRNSKPLLGVCLGHQAIAEYFGGEVSGAARLIHGETSQVEHSGEGIFQGIPTPFRATRYHSLSVRKMPDQLITTARSDDGEIMGLMHESAPIHGVQFHPESVLTEHGHQLLQNWLDSKELSHLLA